MALAKYANRRDKNEKRIIETLEGVGATVVQLNEVDLLCGFRGQNWLLEVKSEKGKMRQSQIDFREMWQGQYAVVWNEDDALRAIGRID